LIEKHILDHFPKHAIVGEEGVNGDQESDYKWIVDPIDGTVNFSYGIPHYCVSIALQYKHEIMIGVVYDPQRDELFTSERGKGAYLNNVPMKTSNRGDIKDCILSLGMAKTAESIESAFTQMNFYAHRAKKLRNMGSAALDLAWIASGRLDAYVERGVNWWDIAAGILLIESAGGKVKIAPNSIGKGFEVIATNGSLEMAFV